MVREIIFACQAEEEIAEAYFWYEEREPGLGERFFQALKRSVKAAALQPESIPFGLIGCGAHWFRSFHTQFTSNTMKILFTSIPFIISREIPPAWNGFQIFELRPA